MLENKVIGTKSATAAGTTAGVTATITGATGEALHCTGIECSGDAAAVVTVESPAATILFRKRFAAAFQFSENWEVGELAGAKSADILVKISASTANCEANISAARVANP